MGARSATRTGGSGTVHAASEFKIGLKKRRNEPVFMLKNIFFVFAALLVLEKQPSKR
jgi:hypothetical protein